MPDGWQVLRERPVDPALQRIGEGRVSSVPRAMWGGGAKVGETSGVFLNSAQNIVLEGNIKCIEWIMRTFKLIACIHCPDTISARS